MYLTNAMHSALHAEQGRYYGNHKVVDIRRNGEVADVYNGTVDETHTYIIADDEPINGYMSGVVSANCGEVPLLPYEPCCLGSINLHMFYDPRTNTLDWEFLEYAVRNAITFLDNVQSLSSTPLDEVNYWSKGLRRLGLGVMGWADLLAEMDVPYASDEALVLADRISWFITYFGYLQSMVLATERGSFEMLDVEDANFKHVLDVLNYEPYISRNITEDELKEVGLRNVAVTSIAPTGSIALLAGVNSSIEPFFALAYKRHITQGVGNTAVDTITEINPILFRKMKEQEYTDKDIEELKQYVEEHGSIQDAPEKFDQLKAGFYTSQEIEPEWHIKMQSAWQDHIDNSISKTINLPEESTVDDVRKAIVTMWGMNLKGGTIYRTNSKLFQILNKGTKEN
jgi:ribonucleoside-diphosphate reductase alpha chain